MPDRDALKAEMIRTDDEFRRLHEEHQEHERRLDELKAKTMLSQEEELEEKRLKVAKLHLKDRMAAMLRAHRDGVTA